MTDLRAAREAALTRWHRDLGDNFRAVLPRVLDDLEAIDRAQVPEPFRPVEVMTDEQAAEFAERWVKNFKGEPTPEQRAALQRSLMVTEGGTVTEPPVVRAPTDAELTAWIEAHPREFASWAARQGRIHGGNWPAGGQASPHMTPPVPVSDKTPKAPARAARRPRGGTAT